MARSQWTRETLAAGVRAGDKRALARAISLVEDGDTLAYTIVLVLMPGSGDSVQALKAGIMEIPDVIAINKMDHPAAKTMLNEVRSILSLDRERAWRPPIVLTDATRGENVPELWERVEEHRRALESGGELEERRRRNLAGEVFAVASTRAKAHLERAVADDPELRRLLDEVQRRELDPLSAVREILEKVFRLGDALADGRPGGPAEGREPPAHGLVQDPRRRQHDPLALRRRARERRRR